MKRLAILFVLVMIAAISGASAEPRHLRLYATEGPFEDVKFFLEDAVINQGLTIDYKGRPGLMLERTRAAVGGARIYKHAEFFLFCSAIISRAAMEADATNLSFCPYIIFFYELEKEPGKVYVGYRRPAIVGNKASKKSLIAVDELLHKIIREATE